MGMIQEFKEFAIKGNVIDMAVGVVIGAAFGKVVTAFVEKVVMPPIGMLVGQVDFSQLTLPLNDKAAIQYGAFLNAVIDFVLVAFAIFIVIKQINRLKRPAPASGPPPLTKDQELLTQIRDLMREKKS